MRPKSAVVFLDQSTTSLDQRLNCLNELKNIKGFGKKGIGTNVFCPQLSIWMG